MRARLSALCVAADGQSDCMNSVDNPVDTTAALEEKLRFARAELAAIEGLWEETDAACRRLDRRCACRLLNVDTMVDQWLDALCAAGGSRLTSS
jgi:hypothetical protein